MNDLQISKREMRLAETVSRQLSSSLARRKLVPAFSDFYITRLAGMTPLIASLDTSRIGDHGPYTSDDLLHQLSTDLGGLPVYLSNHSGIRYVVLLSSLPKLPRKVDLPLDAPRGKLAVGVRFSGHPVLLDWEHFLHLAVLGASGSGKSVFLQSLAYQAIRDDMRLMLSDIDQATFGMLQGHPNLAAPIATSPQDAFGLVEQAIAECDRRAALFSALPGGHPQKLSEYNALAVQARLEPLPRMLVVLDEASSVLTAQGGAKGAMGQALATLGWRGRKFGIHFVFAAQEFTKDIIGPVRDQVGLTLCFRVRNGGMAARMGCAGAERIPETRPGLAISDRHGPLQAYYFDAARLGQGVSPALSEQERTIAERAVTHTAGKISRDVLTEWGMGQQEARRLQDDWKLRGWAANDPRQANAVYITPKLSQMLTSQPTQPTQPTQPAALQPVSNPLPGSPTALQLVSNALQPAPTVLQPAGDPAATEMPELTPGEMAILRRAETEGGKATRSLVMVMTRVSEWQARRQLEEWAERGLVEKDPRRANAYVLTPRAKDLVAVSNP